MAEIPAGCRTLRLQASGAEQIPAPAAHVKPRKFQSGCSGRTAAPTHRAPDGAPFAGRIAAGLPDTSDFTMLERFIERTLYASRWLLAPMFLGLSLGLIALGIKFFMEAYEALTHIMTLDEADLVLIVLAMIDITLVASLIVMVMFSGYENFVSRIDMASSTDKLAWLGKFDSGTLKLKVAASIVAISSIHLLRVFMKVEGTENDKIMWYVILHMTFVFSAVLLGVLDKMSFSSHRDPADHKATSST
jgi:uncharacterized protein (TIGR00645 family)